MRIERLEFPAFGPFTGQALDFSAGAPGGLHLVLGANEAGKSSALRGLIGFLYGIPEQSEDDFIHEYKKMRIKAVLRTTAGATLAAIRRKGRTNTLLGPDGQCLDEALLQRELAGLPRDVFDTMFGLDHARLREGGAELARSGGGLGQALFAAAAGLARLRAAAAGLEAQAQALFKPKGQVQRINAAATEHRRLAAEAARLSAPPAEHQRLSAELGRLLAESDALVRDHGRSAAGRAALERVRQALGPLDKRARVLTALTGLGSAPLLSADFRDRRFAAASGLEQARGRMEAAQRALEHTRAELEGVADPGAWLGCAGRIAALQQDLGAHLKARRDRDNLAREAAALRGQAKELLRRLAPDLPLERAAELRLPADAQALVHGLAKERRGLDERLTRAGREAAKLGRELDASRAGLEALPPVPDLADLEAALALALEQGGLEGRLAEERARLEAARSQAGAGLARLAGCWSGTLEQAEALPVPAEPTVERCARELDDLDAGLRDLERGLAEARRGLAEARRQRQGLEAGGPAPTEQALRRARERRDQGWALVRARLEGRPNVAAEQDFAPDLAAGFEQALRDADAAADRLRLQADRAARAAALDAEQVRLEQEQEALADRQARLEDARRACLEDWAGAWKAAGIDPLLPREMRPWLAAHAALAGLARDLRQRAAALAALEQTASRLAAGLAAALEALGESRQSASGLDAAIRRGRAALARLQDLAGRRRELETKVRDLGLRQAEARAEEDAARADLAAWAERWAAAVAPLGLAPDAPPDQAGAMLQDQAGLLAALHDLADKECRIQGIERDARAFAESVGRLVADLAADLAPAPPAEAAAELAARLRAAEARGHRREALAERLEQARAELEAAQAEARGHEQVLALLCSQAGCPDPAGLDAAERASEQRRNLERELRLLEDALLPLAAGEPLDAFAAAALARDRNALEAEAARLDAEIAGLAERRDAANEAVGRVREQLDRMNGSDDQAAELAEEAQAALAGLAADVERYAVLRLAGAILAAEMERYRRERQGPLLAEAGRAFASLTLDRYVGLEVGYDAKDQPVLVAMRPDPDGVVSRLTVGALSDGAADQLYLALRLAYLRHYLERNAPLPFILDDVLVHFDDARSRAALEEFGKVARATQVILFTHHAHLADLAQEVLAPDILFTHHLSPAPAP